MRTYAYLLSALATVCAGLWWVTPTPRGIQWVFWQPLLSEMAPSGSWHRIGASGLIVQFGRAYDHASTPTLRIEWPFELGQNKREPWRQNLILGLVGDYQTETSRARLHDRIGDGIAFAQSHAHTAPHAWYFPVEYDPSWSLSEADVAALDRLPRPLAISAFAGVDWTARPQELATNLRRVVPEDAILLWQDGVGTGVRDIDGAANIIAALRQHFADDHLIIVAEAFRPHPSGEGFIPAPIAGFADQIARYHSEFPELERAGFDGPTYLNRWRVWRLRWALWWRGM